ncbi:synaptotagmin-like protein 2 [Rhinatrema bivittatum]|uniref:synaptotagmin-like protein 2 n=1 Tax=Rhinatrema bivittatum TaxID=194408 RepID=UPI00112935F1|nr:synaptotagmin-like protein 2 [Rhinatrema bivittatum]XP_029441895.1 synaptotagmin-like protein 2 [Rhinatrema bivittatum]XP_029441896.1 synaptotagmin-like protein 2 [Rhinatrema bivittatum]
MKTNIETMLDLSFLTKEEYEQLRKVLQRDAELKKKDSDRIRRLQDSLRDEKKKKCVTGEWFDDVKSQRFQEELQGSDLLRASIRKKKNRTENENTEQVCDHEQGKPSPAPAQSASPLEPSPVLPRNERSNETEDSKNEEPQTLSKLKVKLPELTVPEATASSLSEKAYSLNNASPADSGIGLSPFMTTNNSQPLEKDQEVTPSPPQFSETDVAQSNHSVQEVDFATMKQRSHEELGTHSKIPVKSKTSKGLPKEDIFLDNFEQSNGNLNKTESHHNSDLSLAENENNTVLKQGSNYTICSMKDKANDQEVILDRDHFMTLKKFWEKGAELTGGNNEALEKPNLAESTRRQSFTTSRALHSNKSQSEEEKIVPDIPCRARQLLQRQVTFSSSEDEHSYVAPPRKVASSSIPRSTYGKSKGSSATRSISIAERNGGHPGEEESKSPHRSSKKSKLPVRFPSVQLDNKTEIPSPTKDSLLSISTPEASASVEEYIVPANAKRNVDSLQSKVQILIDAVTSDDERDKITLTGQNHTEEPTLTANGEVAQVETAVNQEEENEESPVILALARANVLSNARSMVNIYTSTETYNKPQTITHQLLEPERAKELSRSTPALLSETESDTASEVSFQLNKHRKTLSIGSHSSDMASVSSVSNSVLSVYSGDFGSVDAQGMVQFALDYDEKNREFQIYVAQCKDLAIVDERKGRSDPYVKTYLLPDKARMGKRKTSVKKRTVNPVYQEVLRYKIEKMVLLIQKLSLSVWHNDPLGRNSFLGEMEMDLASWDWSNRKLNWYTLKPRSLSASSDVDHRGVMNLSIRYIPPGSLGNMQGVKNPPSGEVHIWVKDIKDLPQLRPSGVDSFVKCYVLPDTSKKSYQKTRVIKKDPNPVFNHTIVYDGFHTEDLKDACVELTVWDHEKLTNHFLGGIRLGLGTGYSYGIPVDWMDSTQEETALWQEMTAAPGEWIEGSLPLRSLAGRRKLK